MNKNIGKIIAFFIVCLLGLGKVFIDNVNKGTAPVSQMVSNSQNENDKTEFSKKNKNKNKNQSNKNRNKIKNTGNETVEKTKNSSNKKYNIDYDHVIGGDENSAGKVTGGHTLLKGDVRIVKKIGKPAQNGVYKATVEIRRKNGTWQVKTSNGSVNTMFPEDWDETRVIDEINSAWENRKDLRGRDSNMWQGKSKSGVIIRGYKSPRITAYPIMEGGR